MSEYDAVEQAILDRHEPVWVAQGYEVVRHPARADLPDFLRRYVPDAVLLGRTPNVVVEVVFKGQPQVERKVRGLKALLKDHDDWRLEVLYAGQVPDLLPSATVDSLEDALASVRRLVPEEPRGALLLAWAALEATARGLEEEKMKRPQTPARVIELLAGAGHVAPSEAGELRQSAQLRNRIAHGDLDVQPSSDQVLKLAAITDDLIDVLQQRLSSGPRL